MGAVQNTKVLDSIYTNDFSWKGVSAALAGTTAAVANGVFSFSAMAALMKTGGSRWLMVGLGMHFVWGSMLLGGAVGYLAYRALSQAPLADK
jgi:hypothetical protein